MQEGGKKIEVQKHGEGLLPFMQLMETRDIIRDKLQGRRKTQDMQFMRERQGVENNQHKKDRAGN